MYIGWIFLILVILAFGATLVVNASGKEIVEDEPVLLSLPTEKLIRKDIAMFIESAYQENDYFHVDICYSLPDERDWILTSHPDDALLTVDGISQRLREEGIMDMKFSSDGKPYERCQYLLFPVVIRSGASIGLSLKKIYVSEPDQVDCNVLQEKLDNAGSGIKVSCPTEPGVGGFTVAERPSTITNEYAQETAYDLLTDARVGPWNFQFEYHKP